MVVEDWEDEFGEDVLTLENDSGTIVLAGGEIAQVVAHALDAYGHSWLSDQLEEEYLIYVSM